MSDIQMVDLLGQYGKIKEEVDQAVLDVIASSQYINGPQVKSFAANLEKYLGVKHVIPCANGTDALQIALMALGLEPGDEVITVDFTFAATVEVVGLLRLTPVLVDVDPDTFNMDPDAIRKAITPKTKAIIPVHLFGQCANMDEIINIAMEHELYIVEDTAQGIGATYLFENGDVDKAGCIGNIGTTSFFPSKNLGGYGDGGALFTNDDELAEIMRSIVNHGMGKRYYYDRIGVNSRLDTIQAAILDIKLKYLDDYIASRQRAAAFYDHNLSKIDGVTVPFRDDKSTHVFHQYTLKLAENIDRNGLVEYLGKQGIPAMIYYPVPLHSQKAYQLHPFKDEDFKVTNQLCKEVVSLPMHTELTEEQQEFICDHIAKFIND